MRPKFLEKDRFERLVKSTAELYYTYYIQRDIKGNLHLVRYSDSLKNPVIGEVRPFEPLKNFFFCAREKVVDGYSSSESVLEEESEPFCALGVKNCDLAGFSILDFVFAQGDFKDPFYVRNRERNLIIAADCSKAIDTCFCHALGHQHYPERNHDILMSELSDGYLVEGISKKGNEFLERHKNLFEEADQRHIEERDRIRKQTGDMVEENIRKNEIPRHSDYRDIIRKNLESEIWEREADFCVECGSCNMICPTCHCFYLVDLMEEKKREVRYKIWDSCMYKRYARVAGGANPRMHLWMRLRNRFEKKFDYFPEISGSYACTGCGRCFSGCPAKIDIRKILKDLVAEARAKVKT